MIPVNNTIYLDRLQPTDAEAITGYMLDKEISDNTSAIPYPYTIDDAHWFINDSIIYEEENGLQKNYAIRNSEGLLLGLIGLHLNYPPAAARSEFGYWLGKPHRNKGIMKAVLRTLISIAPTVYGIKVLEAFVFQHNKASAQVLLAAGFTSTGIVQTRTLRNGTKVQAAKFERQL